ncbi:MAG: thiamine-phosphate kinase [Gammaproteobacteria bacterium]|nr:thiamine-phosphate kinase [Gammaproteobacteria bacterium]|tara:strand:+ start:22313 stop:23320 length:1008 start_codon:yes stop_codon:yes gene_type:complete
MSISEFDIISKYFNQAGITPEAGSTLVYGIGDDCAIVDVPEGKQLVLTMDTLVADVHFFSGDEPAAIARRAMVANISDLAAMGADALAFTLSLTMPKADEAWLESFSEGLRQMVKTYSCPLIGGDLTQGPLSITIQAHGLVEKNRALMRSGARPGDLVFVTGELGAAGLAVSLIKNGMSLQQQDRQDLYQAYYNPQARLEFARQGREKISAAIDISDGLLADAAHIALMSSVNLELQASRIPVAGAVKSILGNLGDRSKGLNHALTAGDDYELLFTASADQESALMEIAAGMKLKLSRIGLVVESKGADRMNRVRCLDKSGDEITLGKAGYRHFS